MSGKSVQQKCQARVSSKGCQERVSRESVKQESALKSALQDAAAPWSLCESSPQRKDKYFLLRSFLCTLLYLQ